ncbi:MAG TPA: hypothetical protein VEL76_24930, partial [Gemmataceae bacterium]|nr:hypothetical protein [Gemmataceae bacterium]
MRRLLFLASLALLPAPAAAQAPALGLRVPDGFEATEFADGKLANDIFCMTVDPKGRVIVSGRGYIRILVEGKDGRAERAIDFAPGPKDGAQGLLWEGDSLYFTGEGGLRRYRDQDGDGRADGPSELIRAIKTGGEHDAHAIRRGPDGWLYVLCGNNAGVNKSFAQLPTSPIREPVAGCVLRFTPDLKKSEIVADGFRNPYGMDFNLDGELFTFDSDNERCVSLPWYEFCRVYHVIPGGHHGWLSPQRASWWRMPPYFPDVVAPITTLGRGSPTGVVCYRHAQFPQHYRGGLFLCDWTFGKIHFVGLQRSGASYTCGKEVFLESVGDNGFAPTAAAVHPITGDLFVSIGGRGTRGAVYRIRYSAGLKQGIDAATARMSLPPPRLDWQPARHKELLAQAKADDALTRLRALVELRRHQEHFQTAELVEVVRANWDHADRYVRKAAGDLITVRDGVRQALLQTPPWTPRQQATFALACCRLDPSAALNLAARVLVAQDADARTKLVAARAMQEALGGLGARSIKGTIWEGYTPREGPPFPAGVSIEALGQAFPSGHADLDRELSRTLAVLADDAPAMLARVADRLTADSDPVEDLHYLIVLARLGAPRTPAITAKVANALLALDRKLTERHLTRDRHWPLRVAELYAELARRDDRLHAALLAHPDLGRADHALFAAAPGFDRKRAAEVFLKRAAADPDYPWNATLVDIVGSLPEERSLPVLRRLWGKAGLEGSLLPLLARQSQAADRDKFVQGLASSQLATVRLSLEALQKLPPQRDGVEILTLIQALGRLPDKGEGASLQKAIGVRLERITGQGKLGADRQEWTAWFVTAYPKLAARLSNPD